MNKIVEIALKRPYTFVVLSILIVILGFRSISETPTDVFPNIKTPVVSVVWSYAGMLPSDVSGRITFFFERALTSTVEGIEHIESHSYYGSSIINVFLQPEVELSGAEAEITAISQTIVNALPPDISPPMIMKLSASSVPVAMLEVTSDQLTPAELYNVSIARIRPELVTIPGAILPHPYGGKPKQMLISLDQQKLMARNMTASDVHEALKRQSLVLPAGDQKIKSKDWMVQTNASPLKETDFNEIPVKRKGNAFVYLKDVADAALAGPPQTNSVLVDGKQAVMIVVMKSSEASTLEVVEGIKEKIPKIERTLPGGVRIRLLNDASKFVDDSIENVLHEMALATFLTGLVVLLFLGSWRATVIIATSIPLSILSALIALYYMGETVNVMTLGGLALAVGILVDDATVMIENIDTHLEMGKPLETAIIDAANQIVIPTFVATLCIIIVWLPLFGISGISGFLFKPMAMAIMFAMMASFIISRTLVPTMAKYMLKEHGHSESDEEDHTTEVTPLTKNAFFNKSLSTVGLTPERTHQWQKTIGTRFNKIQKGFESGFEDLRNKYKNLLEKIIENRGKFVTSFLVFSGLSACLLFLLGQDFYPEIKSGTLQMHMRAPLGTRIEASGRIASLVSRDIEKLLPGEVEGVISNCGLPVGPHNLAFIPTPTIGSQDCDLTISLTNEEAPVWNFRKILRKELSERYPGTVFTFQPADLTAKILNFGSPSPIDVQIKGMEMDDNYEYAKKLAQRFRRISGAKDVSIQQTMNTPTMLVETDRTFGLGLNLTQEKIADNILLSTSGSQQIDQNYWLDHKTGLSYQINVYTPQHELTSLQKLMTVPVNKEGNGEGPKERELVGNLTKVTPVGTPGVITHGDIMPLFDIYVSAEGRDLGGVLHDVEKVMEELKDEAPRTATVRIRGQAETMRSTYWELLIGLLGAVIFVYLLIVINFQSWTDPFIIITALPGALAGISWALFLTDTNLSVPALTGAIMCSGTATANSILVVSYARERMLETNDAFMSAIEAGYARIRPVIMTASAMIIGMLPMSLSNTQNAPLGRAVMGGLLVATFATLFFVPCVYTMVYSKKKPLTGEAV